MMAFSIPAPDSYSASLIALGAAGGIFATVLIVAAFIAFEWLAKRARP